MNTSRVLMLCAVLAACSERNVPQSTATPASQPSPRIEDSTDLSLILNGGSIAARTGEASLEFSVLHAFDGTEKTAWSTPPLAVGALEPPHASAIVALPAKSRVTAISLTNSTTFKSRAVRSVAIALSLDGRTFGKAQSIEANELVTAKSFAIEAGDANFVRIDIMDRHAPEGMLDLPTIAVHGELLEAIAPGRLDGLYDVLGSRGFFRQEQARVRGEIAMDPPMQIDGAWHGPTLRFAWTRGNKRGVGIITAPADGSTFSGLTWFDHASSVSNAWPLFAARVDAPGAPVDVAVIRENLARDRRAPLPQIAVDGGRVLAEANASILGELRALFELNPQAGFRIVYTSGLGDTAEERLAHARNLLASFELAFGAVPANLELRAIAAPPPQESSDYLLARTVNSGFAIELRQ